MNFLCNTTSETKHEIEIDKYYTGHEIFSHIIIIYSWDDINGHLKASKEGIVLALRREIIMSKINFKIIGQIQ